MGLLMLLSSARSWNLRTASQSDVSALNTTATYSSSSNGSVTNSGPVGTFGTVWLASGSNNAAEWTGSGGWLMLGQGSSGSFGIGDMTLGSYSYDATFQNGELTLNAITPIAFAQYASISKYRAARIGSLVYLDAQVSGVWYTILDGVNISIFPAITNYSETAKIGVLHNSTVTNYRVGRYTR